jgi:putative acetyltransferase
MQMFKISEDDLSSHATRQLLALHLAGMHVNSPPESVYALDLSGLKEPEVTVWSVWEANEVIGIGALKEFGNGSGEVKSMALYRKRGFVDGEAFSDYRQSDFNQFLHLPL